MEYLRRVLLAQIREWPEHRNNMPRKGTAKHQLSTRLQFQSRTNRVSGVRRDDEDEDAPQIEGEYGDDGVTMGETAMPLTNFGATNAR